jgi:hypothetical protein
MLYVVVDGPSTSKLAVVLGDGALFEIVKDGPFVTMSADPVKATDWLPVGAKASSTKVRRPLEPPDPVKLTFRLQVPFPEIVNCAVTEGLGGVQPLLVAIPRINPAGGVMPVMTRGVFPLFCRVSVWATFTVVKLTLAGLKLRTGAA